MQFKEGLGWKACHDEERNMYTAQRSWRGFYQLCEIDAETYNKLSDDGNADKLIGSGRVLFESDDDYYTQRYYRIVDENYAELAPWASANWPANRTYWTGDMRSSIDFREWDLPMEARSMIARSISGLLTRKAELPWMRKRSFRHVPYRSLLLRYA